MTIRRPLEEPLLELSSRLPERMFHLRETRGAEVDLLIEEGGRLTAVEVKSGATVIPDFFRGLRRLADELTEQASHLTLDPRVVYGGDASQSRSAATVIPWRELHAHAW
ncbi:MAG: hypothetical protein ACLF0P_14745 [Thermoanaerobaculia bacterium]